MRIVSASGLVVLVAVAGACATSAGRRPDSAPLKKQLAALGVEGRTYLNDLGNVASIHVHRVHMVDEDLLLEDIHGHLTYIEGATLNPRWDYYGLSRPFDHAPDSTPSAVIGISGGKLYVLERSNGTTTIDPTRVDVIPSAAPVATESTLYVPTFKTPAGNKTMYAISIGNGYQGWGARTDSDIVGDMAKGGQGAGDTVYFATQDGTVYAYPAVGATERSPSPAWVSSVAAPVFQDLEVEGDDLAVVTDDGRLVLMDRITGNVRWEAYPDAGEHAGSAAQFSRDHVFYRVGGELRVFDRATGMRLWGVSGATSFIAQRGDRVLLTGEDDQVLSVEAKTGKVLKRVKLAGWRFPRRVRPDTTVYAVSDRGMILAIEHGL